VLPPLPPSSPGELSGEVTRSLRPAPLPDALLYDALARAALMRGRPRAPGDDLESVALMGVVAAYTRACRGAGLSSEAALLAVKAVAAAAGLAPRGPAADGRVLADVVRWCIGAYYGAARPGAGRSPGTAAGDGGRQGSEAGVQAPSDGACSRPGVESSAWLSAPRARAEAPNSI